MKKILFFVSGGCGGSERVTVTIAKMMQQKYDVTIVITSDSKSSISSFIPSNIKTIFLSEKKLHLSAFFKILKTILSQKPDYVFSSLPLLSSFIIISCKLFARSVSVIVRSDNNPSNWIVNNKFTYYLVKYIYPFADKIVIQTPKMMNDYLNLLGIKKEKCYLRLNPIDSQSIENGIKEANPFSENSQYKYVAVGRWNYQKGYDLLIKAMKKVVQFNPLSHLYIIGLKPKNEHTAMLDKLIIENNLQDNIHELGLQHNPYKYIYYSDCFVLSSRYEGLPNVLIESTYLEKQAVAFKCIPIIEEIIIDHTNGLCVEPENVEELADAMIQIQSMNLNSASPYKPSSANDFYSIFS